MKKECNQKKDILSLPFAALEIEMQRLGQPKFRSKQIYQWLHIKLADDFADMHNLPKAFRQVLASDYEIAKLTVVQKQVSKEDGTVKYLFALADGNTIESVYMPYRHGNAVCISSQVGCGMGCIFCASAQGGLVRNLTVSELLGQVYQIQRLSGKRVANVVLMGTGEPLHNFAHLVTFVRMLSDAHGLQISQRNITVSTCGLVPEILALAEEKLQITLALSLHGASQEKRVAWMPIARKYPLDMVLDACDIYFAKTGRRITYEYTLIAGVNDIKADAAELAELLKGKNAHLNLIPINPIQGQDAQKPNRQSTLNFKNKLEKSGINVTIRREMGADMDAACGQLRSNHREMSVEIDGACGQLRRAVLEKE
ncbi:MAG: 23S rRNA (adenine(2503)-C(2))-methyltransferase RlmN [Lachnospiraceae bacterium]|nr:23S rRNA (adenine(2503)-C(2))-methyltransferase RlmN [Lachnospiraceae bacterium]